jgi:hypothetical protein
MLGRRVCSSYVVCSCGRPEAGSHWQLHGKLLHILRELHKLQALCKQLFACLQISVKIPAKKKPDKLLDAVSRVLSKAGHFSTAASCSTVNIYHRAVYLALDTEGQTAAGEKVMQWGDEDKLTAKELCLTLRKFADLLVAKAPNAPQPDDISELVRYINLLLAAQSAGSA